MGVCFSAAQGKKSGSNHVVLLLGLDGSGATTVLYQLLLGRHLQTIPTLGYNHETVTVDDMELDCWDIGGLEKMRHLWAQYSVEADGIVFVVDSSDSERYDQACNELKRIFSPSEDPQPPLSSLSSGTDDSSPAVHAVVRKTDMTKVPLLVLANKQDVKGALSPEELSKRLDFDALPCVNKNIMGCSALNLPSLQTGLKWMTDHFKQNNVPKRGKRPPEVAGSVAAKVPPSVPAKLPAKA